MGGKKKGPTDEEKAASAAKKAAEQKARAEVAIFKAARDDDVKRVEAVSYTHLTLPTTPYV